MISHDETLEVLTELVDDLTRKARSCRDLARTPGQSDAETRRLFSKGSTYNHSAVLLAEAIERVKLVASDELAERAATALDRGVTPTERLELLDLAGKWSELGRGDTSKRGAVVRSCAGELRAVMARHDAEKT